MSFFSDEFKATWSLRLFGFLKIPMLFRAWPKVIEVNDRRCEVRIPLRRFTANHERSMYLGALTVGADIAGGLIAVYKIRKSGRKVRFLFKSMTSQYRKRAEGHVHFSCEDGAAIDELCALAMDSGQRHNMPVTIVARCPGKLGDEPVAVFEMEISIKDVTGDPNARGAL